MIEVITMKTGERYKIIERNFNSGHIKIKRILRPRFINAGFKGSEFWVKKAGFLENTIKEMEEPDD